MKAAFGACAAAQKQRYVSLGLPSPPPVALATRFAFASVSAAKDIFHSVSYEPCFFDLGLGVLSRRVDLHLRVFVCFCCVFCLCVHRLAITLLYESPGGNQVDGLPPVCHMV